MFAQTQKQIISVVANYLSTTGGAGSFVFLLVIRV
jgi:hypothetical protein